MITYNHAEYIEEAIMGVLNQKVDFDIELVISNDCSTDETDKVIRSIIENCEDGGRIKYFSHEKNLGMNPNFLFCVSKCNGKYIAMCEGDDYWIDTQKLQKQVEFLECNKEFGLIHTGYKVFTQKDERFTHWKPKGIKNGSVHLSLLRNNFISTLTVCVQKELIDLAKIQQFIDKGYRVGDYPLWLDISSKAKFYYLDEITSVYRVLPSSAMHGNFRKSFKMALNVNSIKKDFYYELPNVSLMFFLHFYYEYYTKPLKTIWGWLKLKL